MARPGSSTSRWPVCRSSRRSSRGRGRPSASCSCSDRPIIGATASVTEGVAVAAAPTFNGSSVIVDLTGVTDAQYVTVSLANVASSDGSAGGSGSVRVGFLAGDTNQSGVVSLADLGLINAVQTQNVFPTNFLRDVNASGTLTVADKGITNANLTKALPPP